mgnify:CR=1 FL=1
MYNHTGLQGRLTADPELRYTQQGTAITSFTLASDTGRKTKDGKNVPLWMGIKLCVTNKYFIMFFMLAVFLSFYEAVTGTCNAYYAQYILGNRDLLGALASFESIPQIVTVLVLSPFIAKFGKRNVALIGAIVAVIGTVSLVHQPDAPSILHCLPASCAASARAASAASSTPCSLTLSSTAHGRAASVYRA